MSRPALSLKWTILVPELAVGGAACDASSNSMHVQNTASRSQSAFPFYTAMCTIVFANVDICDWEIQVGLQLVHTDIHQLSVQAKLCIENLKSLSLLLH